MIAIPVVSPVIDPPPVVIVITPGLELLHVPPAGDPVSVLELPVQIASVPDIEVGRAFTRIVAVLKQLEPNV